MKVTIEEMKQMMVVTAAKRCQGRIYRFYQNRINSLQSKAILQKIESAWKKSKDEEDRWWRIEKHFGSTVYFKKLEYSLSGIVRYPEFRASRYLEQGFYPHMDDFLSLSQTMVKMYCKNSNF